MGNTYDISFYWDFETCVTFEFACFYTQINRSLIDLCISGLINVSPYLAIESTPYNNTVGWGWGNLCLKLFLRFKSCVLM